MKAILVIAALVLILAVVGWVTFGTDGDRPSMTIETDRVRQDTQQAVERGREVIERAGEEIREEIHEQRRDEPLPDERPPLRSGDETTHTGTVRDVAIRV